MKRLFLILAAAVALSSLAFAEKHTVTAVRYKQTLWGGGGIRFVDITYMDNFASVIADNDEPDLFIRIDAPRVDYPQSPYDLLRASYTRFGKQTQELSLILPMAIQVRLNQRLKVNRCTKLEKRMSDGFSENLQTRSEANFSAATKNMT